ncbi:MAG: LysR family transcriptional regulator [Bacteriovoracaceae bacterium]|nr:LysR family transcriptional regulator [Bacteriovoracaceae bacterium]
MLDIDLNRLFVFKVVVLTGSFSKAGLQLRIPKSRVSRQIASLENELGVPLIYRTTRSFQLTQAGKDLFQKALPSLNDLENVLQSVGDTKTDMQGLLRFTVPEDLGVELMANICHEFTLTHPKVQLDMIVDNRTVDLVKEGVDLALRIGKAKDSSLTGKKVGAVKLELYAGASLFQKHARPTKLEDLHSMPFLSFFGPDQQNFKIKGPKSTFVIKAQPIMNCNSFFVLKKMALLGDGYTLLPSYIARSEIARGELIHLFKDWSFEEVPVQLLYPPQKNMPPRLRAFIDFLSRKLQEKLE